jgi:hypothetical protein
MGHIWEEDGIVGNVRAAKRRGWMVWTVEGRQNRAKDTCRAKRLLG